SLAAIAIVAFLGSLPAVAHGQLNVMCSAAAELCRLFADEFQKETGIKAMLVSTPLGRDALATLAEQKGRPQSDVWLGAAAETLYRAAKFGLVDESASPKVSELQPWAQKSPSNRSHKASASTRVCSASATTPRSPRRRSSPRPPVGRTF